MADTPFNVSALSENELGHVEYVLTSPSYTRVFRPFLMSIHEYCVRSLLDNSETRRKKTSDECLIERAKAVTALVTFFDKIVEEAQIDRIHRARGEVFDEQYDSLKKAGIIGPTGMKETHPIPLEEQY